MSRNCASSAAGLLMAEFRRASAVRAVGDAAQSRANVSLNDACPRLAGATTTRTRAGDDGRGSRRRRRRDDGSDDARTRLAARDRVARARPPRDVVASTRVGESQRIWTRQPRRKRSTFSRRKPPSGMPSRTPRRADFDAMSLKVASTCSRATGGARPSRLRRRARGGLARRPRVYPLRRDRHPPGSICRARACSDAGADLSRGGRAPRRPRGGRRVRLRG